MPTPNKTWRVTYRVDMSITYQVEAPDKETALHDARNSGMEVDQAWESCDLDHVEQVEK